MSDPNSRHGADAPKPDEKRLALLAKLFDLRTFIGSLLTIFGIIVTLEGVTASDADIAKAGDMNISLWSGLVMVVAGICFVSWMLIRPPAPPAETEDPTPVADD